MRPSANSLNDSVALRHVLCRNSCLTYRATASQPAATTLQRNNLVCYLPPWHAATYIYLPSLLCRNCYCRPHRVPYASLTNTLLPWRVVLFITACISPAHRRLNHTCYRRSEYAALFRADGKRFAHAADEFLAYLPTLYTKLFPWRFRNISCFRWLFSSERSFIPRDSTPPLLVCRRCSRIP